MNHFRYDRLGRLLVESVDLEAIAARFGTPTFVYAQSTVERHYRVFDEAFAGHPHLVCYAVKANSNGAILNLLGEMGSGADIVSMGELHRARRAGIPSERIVFSGVGKTADEMAAALEAKILAFNVESEPELRLLAQVARAKNTVAPVSLRVNPDVDAKTHPYISTGLLESKFGIPIRDARRIAQDVRSESSLRLVGIDCHIGSQLTSIQPFLEALDSLLGLVDQLCLDGADIELLDLGGGLGIPYDSSKAEPPHPRELGASVIERMKGRKQRLVLEPGRVIVGNAGVLLTRVLYVKETPARTFVIVDGAMNDLLRPSLYQAYHDIQPVRRDEHRPKALVDIVGPICESSDAFAKQRLLQQVEAGELLAVMGSGAYGFSMASTYNSRTRAAEILVKDGEACVIRERETLESLTSGEALAPWQVKPNAGAAEKDPK